MSGLLGGSPGTQSASPKELNGIQTMQSSYGNAVPLVYGRTRIPGTIIWYANFTATAQTSGGGGGKGGGGTASTTSYTYSAAVIISLGEGQMAAVNNTFADKAIHGPGYTGGSNPWVGNGNALTDFGFTFFSGAVGQTAWTGWPSGTPSTQQLNYSSVAYLTCNNFNLGSSAAMPNMTFEVDGLLGSLASPYRTTAGDIDPASITYDYCSDATHGCGFGPYYNYARNNGISGSFTGTINSGSNQLTITAGAPDPRICPVGTAIVNSTAFPGGATITAWNNFTNVLTVSVNSSANIATGSFTFQPSTWQTYCLAYGFFCSPAETTQRAAQDFLTEMLTLTNSDSIWSNGQQTIIALNDSSVSGNGYTHIPNNGNGASFSTPIYTFTDDDYILQNSSEGTGDPVVCSRRGVSSTYNKVYVEFLDRTNQYNTAVASAFDANDIAINGERVMETVSLHSVCDPTVARLVAQLILQRQLYYKNTYRFQVRPDYMLLEPMDVIALNDSGLGLVNALCRIDTIEEEDDNTLTLEVTELPFGPGVTPQYNYQAGARSWYLTNTSPGAVTTPLIIPAPVELQMANTGMELFILVTGATPSVWGGCNVYMSYDNSNYAMVGQIKSGGARYGTISSTPSAPSTVYSTPVDTSCWMAVTLNDSTKTLSGGTQADADGLRTLCWVGPAGGGGGGGEFMAYQYCTLYSGSTYGFSSTGLSSGTKYWQRSLYGSSPGTSHAVGDIFARIDGAVFRLPIDAGLYGQTIYFKFQSYNIYGRALNALASETAYSYYVSSGYAGLAAVATNWLSAGNGTMGVVGNAAFKSSTGATAWDSSVNSPTPLLGGCVITGQADDLTSNIFIGLSTAQLSATSNNYNSISYGIQFSAGTFYIYESGTKVLSCGTIQSFGPYAKGDTVAVSYDGKFVRYTKNGATLRTVQVASGLALYGVVTIYQAGVSLPGVTFATLKQEGGLISNLLPFNAWQVGATCAPYVPIGNYYDYLSGAYAASDIVIADNSMIPYGPYGSSEPIWQCNGASNTASTGADGGFINGPSAQISGMPTYGTGDLQGLDPNKTYRYSVWFQYTGTATAGSVYFGGDTNGSVYNLGSGTAGGANTNPYFNYCWMPNLVAGQWYLMVGLMHGAQYNVNVYTGTSGIYDPTTGLKVATGTNNAEFKSGPGITSQTIRALIYSVQPNTVKGYFARPRVEEVNGLEPSINSMLNSASVYQVGSNAITNSYTFTGSGSASTTASVSLGPIAGTVFTFPAAPTAGVLRISTSYTQYAYLSAGTYVSVTYLPLIKVNAASYTSGTPASSQQVPYNPGYPGIYIEGFITFQEYSIAVNAGDVVTLAYGWAATGVSGGTLTLTVPSIGYAGTLLKR